MSRCIIKVWHLHEILWHLNEQWKSSAHTHLYTHTRTHMHIVAVTLLECPWIYSFSSEGPHFLFCTTQSDMQLKTCLKGALHTQKTHLWCRQMLTSLLKECFYNQILHTHHKPGASNLDRTGTGRKWCHSQSTRSPDTDKAALPGKVKQERDR